MVEAQDNCTKLARDLKLQSAEADLFIGKLRGFPIGLKFIDPAGSALLLFQVRYPQPVNATEPSNLEYSEEVTRLITEKKLDIEFEDKLAWITIVEGAKHLTDGSVLRLLNDILSTFEKAGLIGNPDFCHYCQQVRVETVMCVHGKVVQICAACLAERTSPSTNRVAKANEGALPIAVLAPMAALVGALGWSLFWIGYDLLFDLLKKNVIVIPRVVELVVLVCVAGVTGGPVGYVIRRIRYRGQKLSIMFAGVCTILAVVVGEVVYITWLIYHKFKVFSPRAALEILPQVEMDVGEFHLTIKLAAAVCAVVLAVQIAKPPKSKLKI